MTYKMRVSLFSCNSAKDAKSVNKKKKHDIRIAIPM